MDTGLDTQFLELSSQGLTKVQIAVRLGLQCRDLLSRLSPGILEQGKELCQVYHENLMDQMIKNELRAGTKEKELQAWRLKVMFRDDWGDKRDSSSALSEFENLSLDELKIRINNLLQKLTGNSAIV